MVRMKLSGPRRTCGSVLRSGALGWVTEPGTLNGVNGVDVPFARSHKRPSPVGRSGHAGSLPAVVILVVAPAVGWTTGSTRLEFEVMGPADGERKAGRLSFGRNPVTGEVCQPASFARTLALLVSASSFDSEGPSAGIREDNDTAVAPSLSSARTGEDDSAAVAPLLPTVTTGAADCAAFTRPFSISDDI